MMKVAYYWMFLLVMVSTQCTNKSDATREVREAPITGISCPKTAITGDDVPITVTFMGMNGCAKPYEIKAEKVGQSIQLRAYASYPDEPVACTQVLTELSLDYLFFADLPGVYFFHKGDYSTVADTLKVY